MAPHKARTGTTRPMKPCSCQRPAGRSRQWDHPRHLWSRRGRLRLPCRTGEQSGPHC